MFMHMRYLSFFLLLAITSCIEPRHDYFHYETIKGQEWSYDDTFKFGFKPETAGKYQISLSVRFEKEYEFSNIWLKVLDMSGQNRVEVPLFSPVGKPQGKCSSGLCTQLIPWKVVEVTETDSIYFHIIQNMRRDPLNYISEVGVMVDKLQ